MKLESLVIPDQHAGVNTFPGLVHTARHITKVGCTGSRCSNQLSYRPMKSVVASLESRGAGRTAVRPYANGCMYGSQKRKSIVTEQKCPRPKRRARTRGSLETEQEGGFQDQDAGD